MNKLDRLTLIAIPGHDEHQLMVFLVEGARLSVLYTNERNLTDKQIKAGCPPTAGFIAFSNLFWMHVRNNKLDEETAKRAITRLDEFCEDALDPLRQLAALQATINKEAMNSAPIAAPKTHPQDPKKRPRP